MDDAARISLLRLMCPRCSTSDRWRECNCTDECGSGVCTGKDASVDDKKRKAQIRAVQEAASALDEVVRALEPRQLPLYCDVGRHAGQWRIDFTAYLTDEQWRLVQRIQDGSDDDTG